jgi:site-specific recombinase XerD
MLPFGLRGDNLGPHSLQATTTTSALENNADIAKFQEWLGHAVINTTQEYDRQVTRAPDSPTFNIDY